MPKLVKKSEMAVAADHIMQFQYEADLDYIHGAVQASMKNKTYKVQVCKDLYSGSITHKDLAAKSKNTKPYHICKLYVNFSQQQYQVSRC